MWAQQSTEWAKKLCFTACNVRGIDHIGTKFGVKQWPRFWPTLYIHLNRRVKLVREWLMYAECFTSACKLSQLRRVNGVLDLVRDDFYARRHVVLSAY